MVRRSVRRSVRRNRSKKSKKMYKQRGGAFTDNERNTLINNVQFSEDQVNELDEYPVSFQNIQHANHLYLDDPHTTMIIVSKKLQDLQNQQQDNHNDEPLNLADLQVEEGQGQEEGENALNQGFIEEDEDGDNTDNEDQDVSFDGGKRIKTRKTRKTRKGKKSRKSRKMNGGARFGTGVGANNYDPNYSIYNTPALTLFPYKPN